jgi:hypothetical protein
VFVNISGQSADFVGLALDRCELPAVVEPSVPILLELALPGVTGALTCPGGTRCQPIPAWKQSHDDSLGIAPVLREPLRFPGFSALRLSIWMVT